MCFLCSASAGAEAVNTLPPSRRDPRFLFNSLHDVLRRPLARASHLDLFYVQGLPSQYLVRTAQQQPPSPPRAHRLVPQDAPIKTAWASARTERIIPDTTSSTFATQSCPRSMAAVSARYVRHCARHQLTGLTWEHSGRNATQRL
jgi:hypothetical protein